MLKEKGKNYFEIIQMPDGKNKAKIYINEVNNRKKS
jgi:hypothetical protein